MKKISIIIPVYNAERTIIRCLSSLVNTEYENYEIIIIDDGSTDDSLQIIKDFAKTNNQIVLYCQKNKGPSAARNKGIELAQGDIIAFVDSDDYVNNDYLSKIAKAFIEEAADIVFFAFNRVTPNGEILSTHSLPTIDKDYYNNLMNLSINDVFGYTWIKAFCRNIIGKNHFDETIELFEDEIFTCQVLKSPVKVVYLNEVLYNYVRMDGTLANKTTQNYSKISNRVWNEWKFLLPDNNSANVFLENKANHIAMNCKWYVLERDVHRTEFYKDIANSDYIKSISVDDYFLEMIKDQKWNKVFIYNIYYKAKVLISRLFKK